MQQEIAAIIQREISDPRLPAITSVTRVKVSEDLSTADVYVSIMGTPGEQSAGLNALKHSAGMMRGKLTRAMSLRHAPYIKFHVDEGLKKEMALLDLIRQVNEERRAKEQAEGGPETAAAADSTEDAPPAAHDGQDDK
jgi:ribosome-binding factor A